MPPKSQPSAARSKFVVTPFTPERMAHLGDTLVGDIQARLDRAENILDAPAAPLRPSYAKWKARKFPQVPTIRNLRASGITRGTIRTLTTAENRALIGSTDARANRVLAFNQRRDPQWGVSRRNRERIEAEINRMRTVRAVKP